MPVGLPADTETLRKYSTWFIIYGVLMILLGIFAIARPGVATLAIELTVGWLLIISGLVGLIAVISAGTKAPGFWWNLLTSILYLVAGVVLLARPLAGIITLTIILVAYLLAGGIAHIAMAIGYRTQLPSAWVWMLISGLVDIVLALIIMAGFPGTAAWVIGLMVGINFVMMGFAILMAALAIRKEAGTPAPAPK
jgi:uncharacterized membrane protein HdeD (DUF308 family)